ncbi:hypothetical protein L1887_03628 [Cichorium endivia]|nr:hypothetical protein L1887_03628 [Cichorium endivia]
MDENDYQSDSFSYSDFILEDHELVGLATVDMDECHTVVDPTVEMDHAEEGRRQQQQPAKGPNTTTVRANVGGNAGSYDAWICGGFQGTYDVFGRGMLGRVKGLGRGMCWTFRETGRGSWVRLPVIGRGSVLGRGGGGDFVREGGI